MTPSDRPCRTCGATIEASAGRGRPRLYCSPKCRREAEIAQRHGQAITHPHEFVPAPSGVGSICRHCESAPRSKVGRLAVCPCR